MATGRSTSLPARDRLAWFAQVFTVLLVVWIALNGLSDLPVGVLAAGTGAAAGTWLAAQAPYPWHPLRWTCFAAFFLWESFKGGLDVAYRALHPALLINPSFNEYRISLSTGKPTTLLVSFISLLPGTLSADLEESRQRLIVHALTEESLASVERLENILAWVFSEAGHSS